MSGLNEKERDYLTLLATQIEGDFIAMLDEWHSLPETWDSELDAQIHRWYAEILTRKPVFPKRPYFSPSSANSCPRELYEKITGAKRDEQEIQPHQKRWTSLGTAIGDMIQRDILFIEKHFEAKTGNRPPFTFERTDEGFPMFEDFAKKNHKVNHRGHTFYLYGTPDGILKYVTDDGELIRVGLEIKSKQTTAAQTSLYSMREPKQDHVKQTIAYSAMYGVDHYIILYVNAAKSGWVVDDETARKTPDIRAFYVNITDDDRRDLFDYFADVMDAVEANKPPKVDLDKWQFNNYKTAIALSLNDEELDEIASKVERMKRSRLPEWMKKGYVDALKFIEEVRKGAVLK